MRLLNVTLLTPLIKQKDFTGLLSHRYYIIYYKKDIAI